jgi:hypothetical protein
MAFSPNLNAFDNVNFPTLQLLVLKIESGKWGGVGVNPQPS